MAESIHSTTLVKKTKGWLIKMENPYPVLCQYFRTQAILPENEKIPICLQQIKGMGWDSHIFLWHIVQPLSYPAFLGKASKNKVSTDSTTTNHSKKLPEGKQKAAKQIGDFLQIFATNIFGSLFQMVKSLEGRTIFGRVNHFCNKHLKGNSLNFRCNNPSTASLPINLGDPNVLRQLVGTRRPITQHLSAWVVGFVLGKQRLGTVVFQTNRWRMKTGVQTTSCVWMCYSDQINFVDWKASLWQFKLDLSSPCFSKNKALFWRVTTPDVDTGYAATRV